MKSNLLSLQTNKLGSYFLYSKSNFSKYQGLICNVNDIYFKVIDSITFDNNFINFEADIDCSFHDNKISLNKVFLNQYFKNQISEKIHFNKNDNSLLFNFNKETLFQFDLDVRKMDDFSDWDRQYLFETSNNMIIIKYFKNGSKIDNYSLFVVIKSNNLIDLKIPDPNLSWIKKEYDYDKKRNSYPFERYVYSNFSFKSNKFVLSVSDDLNKAIDMVESDFNNFDNIINENKLLKSNAGTDIGIIDLSYKNATDSLNQLLVVKNNQVYLMAGLPWFYQNWSRDELFSLIGFLINKQFKESKEILFRYLNSIEEDGRIKNISGINVTNADSIGLLFKRIKDYMFYTKNNSEFELNNSELNFIKDKLKDSIYNLIKNYSLNGFIVNNKNETWMDAGDSFDPRDSVCIEINALFLNMISFYYDLTKDENYKRMQEAYTLRIKEHFLKDDILCDRLSDATIRPNVFLAYYFYNSLLTDYEWKKVFDTALVHLYLDLGGLSSIDKNSKLFVDNSTGENKASYHRGDSWFFINNIAAICLFKLDKNFYSNYIKDILHASTYDILCSGIIGSASEISSAKEYVALGCLNQAWSNATYIEFIDTLY